MKYVYFLYPLFFYAVISYIFVDINPMPNDGYLMLKSYVGYALLINFHTAFTFYNFSFNQNYKDLVLERYGAYTKFVLKYVAIFLSFVTVFWIIIFYGHKLSSQLTLFLFSITGFLNLHHHLSQTKGLSNFYFFKKNEKETQVSLEFVSEKKLYSALVVTTGLGIITTYTSFFIKDVFMARLIFSSAVLIFVVLILFNSYRLRKLFGIDKFLFQLRFLVYPLVVYFGAIPGDIFLSVTHGVEYTSLNSKIIKNEKTFRKKKITYLVIFLILIGYLSIGRRDGLSIFILDENERPPYLFKLFAVLSMSLTYTNFFLDKLSFSFSKADVKKHILPLLKK